MRVAGIRYRIQPSFYVATAFLASSRFSEPITLVEWALVAIVSITVHELGHALVARAFGLAPSIELHAMGGTTSYASARPLRSWQHIAISLAGPGFGLALGAAVFACTPFFPENRLALVTRADLLWINIGWGAMNLLPVLPLDGGHVAERLTNARVARVISVVTAVGLAVAALVWHLEAAVFMLVILAIMNFMPRAPKAPRRFEAGWKAFQDRDFVTAERTAREALATLAAADVDGRKEAAELLTWSLLRASRFDEALRALDEFPPIAPADSRLRGLILLFAQKPAEALPLLRAAFEKSPDAEAAMFLVRALLGTGQLDEAIRFVTTESGAVDTHAFQPVCAALFQAGRFDDSLALGTLAFERIGEPIYAYNNACCEARAGRPDAAFDWLSRAVIAGYANVAELDADVDLASLHSDPRFTVLRNRLAATRG